MRITVLVTTYKRPDFLKRCLESICSQDRVPDEIVVVNRVGDTETEDFVAGFISSGTSDESSTRLVNAKVTEPGVLAANREGMKLVSGDIVCFIDDDAAARPDWLAKIETHFQSDSTIGAVGGRDFQHRGDGISDGPTDRVGRILWYGKIIGNNHLAFKGSCFVEHLKGVNMSFRRELIPSFDRHILGNAHYYEMDVCFAVRHAGYRVLYDGDLIVDHYVKAPRFLAGNASGEDLEREFFTHHNRVYVMMKNLTPVRRMAFLVYTFGRDSMTGLAKLVLRSGATSRELLQAMYRGKLAGLQDYRRQLRQ